MGESIHKNLESESGDLSGFSQEEEVELKLEDVGGLFPPEEKSRPETGEALTPEKIKQVWDGLSDTEKRFVVSNQKVFDLVLPRYEQQVGSQKTRLLSALRKLIFSHDPRAALIEAEIKR